MTRKSELEKRVQHCDIYHMPLDEQLQGLHEQMAATAEDGTVADFEQAFSVIEDTKRVNVLMEMYQQLPPVEQARLVAQLTGNLGMQEFVDTIDTSRNAYADSMLRIEAETQEYQAFRTADIPKDTTLKIYMAITGRVQQETSMRAKASLTWERLLVARALGKDRFTLVEQGCATEYTYGPDESFYGHETAKIGTPVQAKDGALYLDGFLRFGEALGAKVVGENTTVLNVLHKRTATAISLRITHVVADGELLLPYLED